MMKPESKSSIKHDGKVIKVENGTVIVGIIAHSACSGCHSEGLCSLSDKKEKIVNIKGNYNVSPGDSVTILMQQSSGYKAVVVSYVIPLVILMVCLVTLSSFYFNELASGLISIFILIPYYFVLYFFRKKINRSFNFTLKT